MIRKTRKASRIQESDPHPFYAAQTGGRGQRLLGGNYLADDDTGLYRYWPVFHQIHIASEKQIPLFIWTSNYIWYALAAICGALISGMLVDRFSAHRSAVVAQIPMILACLVLMISDSYLTLAVFFVLFGCAGGMGQRAGKCAAGRTLWLQMAGRDKSTCQPLKCLFQCLIASGDGYII